MFSTLVGKLFEKKRINKLESVIIYLSIFGMVLHFLLIFFAKQGIIVDDYLAKQGFLEVIATPFTIILIYEIFLLVASVAKSMSISIGKQYEIIALVLVRDVFKIISSYQFDQVTPINTEAILAIGFDILFAIICFVGIAYYYKSQNNCAKLLDKQELEKGVVEFKSIGSILLLVTLAAFLGSYFMNLISSGNWATFFDVFKRLEFIAEFFVFMVIVDIALLLLAFNKSHNFRDIFYEAVLIISAIVVRFAFVSTAPWNGILATAGIFIGVAISLLYSRVSKYIN